MGAPSPPDRPPGDAAPIALAPGTSEKGEDKPGLARPEPPTKREAGGTRPEETRAPESLRVPRPGPSSNQRRPNHLMRLFILLAFANAALFVACAMWFYTKTRDDLEKRFESLATTVHPSTQPAPPAPPAIAGPAVEKMLATATGELKKQIVELRSSQDDLRKRLDASEKRAAETTRQVAGISALVDEVKRGADRKDPPPPSPAVAEEIPPTSQSELVLLKERNRLTAYADEAIATGARGPYERLWDAIEDPRLANLVHAARAEILRVQDCYIHGQRVKFYNIQQHQIPVAEIFPESAALAAAQLSDDQLIQVLQDLKQPWQSRVKAAWHLGQRRNTKVGDALVKAIKSDPVLDVAAEATFSFEQITGYHAKLFEIPPLEAWWKSYTEKTPDPKLIPKTPQREGAGVKTRAK